MSSRLQLDMRNLSLGRRHLVNAYEVEAGIGVIAGNIVWSMPERLECEVLQKVRYINTLTFTFTFVTGFVLRHRLQYWTTQVLLFLYEYYYLQERDHATCWLFINATSEEPDAS